MIRCKYCKIKQPVSEFRAHNMSRCRTCCKRYALEFLAPKRKILDKIKLEAGCADCGYRKHPAALDFDHLPGFVKLFPIGNRMANHTIEELLREVTKCEVVCSNCHRIRNDIRIKGA